jgi:hypothetical protein
MKKFTRNYVFFMILRDLFDPLTDLEEIFVSPDVFYVSMDQHSTSIQHRTYLMLVFLPK